ncbi:MAG: hypothetical protein NT154_05225 [Verrucomicrobia bacterium]|nr:hypothetical protein [Verrucomicrobiota bacterium]
MGLNQPRPLKSLEPSALNYLRTNHAIAEGAHSRNSAAQLRYAQSRQPPTGKSPLHPFKLYQYPSLFRDGTSADDWRKYRVRAGNVLGTNATGTDAQDTDPDTEIYPPTATDITVPANTAKYWFWLEIDSGATPATAIVRHGTDPTDDSYAIPWDTAPENPVPDANHITIGYIDTLTNAADCIPIVRQLLREDIVSVGSSAPTRMVVKEVHGNYLTCRTVSGYSDDEAGVVIGDTDIQVAKPFSLRRGEIDPEDAYAVYDPGLERRFRPDVSILTPLNSLERSL